jgi:hypothetical protein
MAFKLTNFSIVRKFSFIHFQAVADEFFMNKKILTLNLLH